MLKIGVYLKILCSELVFSRKQKNKWCKKYYMLVYFKKTIYSEHLIKRNYNVTKPYKNIIFGKVKMHLAYDHLKPLIQL